MVSWNYCYNIYKLSLNLVILSKSMETLRQFGPPDNTTQDREGKISRREIPEEDECVYTTCNISYIGS